MKMSKRTLASMLSVLFAVSLVVMPNTTKVKASTITDANNGNWSSNYVELYNTSEATLMVRTGNINNFTYGWSSGFNPFSGNATPVHSFPWTMPSDTTQGTDRIMVVSGFTYDPSWDSGRYPTGGCTVHYDGYTQVSMDSNHNIKSANTVRPINLSYDLKTINVTDASFQMFVDDFQPGNAKGVSQGNVQYQVTLNGQHIPDWDAIFNNLDESGPIGRMITLNVPDAYLGIIKTGNVSIKIDDPRTGRTGDGYAIDFVKLLINKQKVDHTVTISGVVRDKDTNQPIANAKVSGGPVDVYTDSNGEYILNNVPAGQSVLTASADGYISQNQTIDTVELNTYKVNFSLSKAPISATINAGNRIFSSTSPKPGEEVTLTSTITPQDITGTSGLVSTTKVTNVTFAETLPDGISVDTTLLPPGFTVSGSTILGNLNDITYTLQPDKKTYTAPASTFSFKVKAMKAGTYTFNSASLSYTDCSGTYKTSKYDPIKLNVGYNLPTQVVTLDPSERVNHSVTVTISNWGDATTKQYKEENGGWTDYTGPITINDNETIQISGSIIGPDGTKYESDSSVKIINIDKAPPTGTATAVKQPDGTYIATLSNLADQGDGLDGLKGTASVINSDVTINHNPDGTYSCIINSPGFDFKVSDDLGNTADIPVDYSLDIQR